MYTDSAGVDRTRRGSLRLAPIMVVIIFHRTIMYVNAPCPISVAPVLIVIISVGPGYSYYVNPY